MSIDFCRYMRIVFSISLRNDEDNEMVRQLSARNLGLLGLLKNIPVEVCQRAGMCPSFRLAIKIVFMMSLMRGHAFIMSEFVVSSGPGALLLFRLLKARSR